MDWSQFVIGLKKIDFLILLQAKVIRYDFN